MAIRDKSKLENNKYEVSNDSPIKEVPKPTKVIDYWS